MFLQHDIAYISAINANNNAFSAFTYNHMQNRSSKALLSNFFSNKLNYIVIFYVKS